MSKKEKMDFAKVLAMLAQPKEPLPPLKNVERMRIEVPYITKDETIDVRAVRVIFLKEVLRPVPLVYVPHYEMGEDSLELRDYLKEGWAVACPSEFDNKYNGQLTDDDLVFNNAALYTLRHRAEFDRKRIVLAGGSAGGYMTMMLNALQLGICASIANGPITNVYYNFYYHFQHANALNMKTLAQLIDQSEDNSKNGEENVKTPLDVMQSLAKLPIPFIAAVTGMFSPILKNFPDAADVKRWEALSAVGNADCFCSPILVTHCTSDILVPVDQITRKFTYNKPGESLPEDFNVRLPLDFPGKLKFSLEECLPKKETAVRRIMVPDADEDCVLPYDISKRFNLDIYDDGPIEGYGSHSSRISHARRSDVPYLKEMIEKTSEQTNMLTPAKLKMLVNRYAGKSIALPAHEGVDDSVYGSLKLYQQEVCEELLDWVCSTDSAALNNVFDQMLESIEDIQEYTEVTDIMNIIKEKCGL